MEKEEGRESKKGCERVCERGMDDTGIYADIYNIIDKERE